MGALKSVTHSYSYGEYLFWYIERNDLANVEKVLERRPDLLNSPALTASFKTTPLHRAAVNGNLQLAQLLVEKYHAAVDARTSNGETPLIGAVKKCKPEMVRYLLAVDASPEELSGSGLRPLDYAVLHGFYEIALALYQRMQEKALRDRLDYEALGSQFHYRYVNYAVLLEHLALGTDEQSVPDFLTKPKQRLDDPVVDPREPWKQWLLRNLEFRDPPLCERAELPEELQPQNRRFGRLSHFMSSLALTHMSQRPAFLPQGDAHTEAKIYGKDALKEQEDVQSVQSI